MELNAPHLWSEALVQPYKEDIEITVHAIHANHCYSFLLCVEIYQISDHKTKAQRFVFNQQCLHSRGCTVAKVRIKFESTKLLHKKITSLSETGEQGSDIVFPLDALQRFYLVSSKASNLGNKING